MRRWSGPRGEVLAFSDANSFWEPRRAPPPGGPARRPGRGVRLRPGAVRRDGSGQPGGPLLALRDGGAGPRVEPGRGRRPATARSTRSVARPTSSSSRPAARTSRFRSSSRSGAGERCMSRERSRASAAADLGRRGVRAQAADDGRRLGTMLRHGLLSLRGYSPMYALEMLSHRLLRYASPLLHLARSRGPTSRCSGRGAVYAVTLGCQLALLAAAALGTVLPLRPLRIAHYYVAVTAASAVGLWDYLRPRRSADVGEGGGNEMTRPPRRADGPACPERAAPSPRRPPGLGGLGARRPLPPVSCDRDQARFARAGDLPTAPGRRGRRDVRPVQAPHDVRWAPTRSGWGLRCSRATPASRGSARCCAASRWTRCPTSSTCCAARWRSSARARR